MYYAKIDVYHSEGLCNRISSLDHVTNCFIDRADVFGDGSVYIELLVKLDEKKKHDNTLFECISSTSESIIMIDMVNTQKAAKMRYIIEPETNSVIRETNKMGFILDFPIIVQEEKEIISGVVYKNESLQTYFDLLKTAGLKYKIRKIVKNEDAQRLCNVRWSWSLSDEVDLTKMQKKIVYTAFKKGYYSFPRKTDIKTIAETVSLSTSTTWEHLRKAEMKFMNLILERERVV
jgi:predicted DNA binding protein